MLVRWRGEELFVGATAYTHKSVRGQISLRLTCLNGTPYCSATVAIPGAFVPENAVVIKNYSENEGVDRALIVAGVIKPNVVGVAYSGYVAAPIYELTDAAIEELL